MRYILVFILISVLVVISFGCAVNQMTIPDAFSATDVAIGSLLIGGMAASLSSHDNATGEWIYQEAATDTGDVADTVSGSTISSSLVQDGFTISNLSDVMVDKVSGVTKTKFTGIISNSNSTDYQIWYEFRLYDSKNKLQVVDSSREPLAVLAGQTRPFAIYRDYDPSLMRIEIYRISNIQETEETKTIWLKSHDEKISGNTLTGKMFNLGDSVTDLTLVVGFYDRNDRLVDVQTSTIDSLAQNADATYSVTSNNVFHSYSTSLTYALEYELTTATKPSSNQ